MATESPSLQTRNDHYTDIYRTYSQATDTTANDIDLRKYPLSWKTVKIYMSASIGGLLFGYDGGAIAGVLLAIRPQDLQLEDLKDYQKGLITGTAGFGAFCGSICAFPLADRLGRKRTIGLCSVLFTLAAIIMALAKSLSVLVAGRLILGTAVGIAAQCVPIYLSEVSPSSARGTILALNTLAITSGQLLACTLSWFIINQPYAWRLLFALGGLPAVMLLILLKSLPESPRWLLLTGSPQEARESLCVIYPKASDVQIINKMVKIMRNMSIIHREGENSPLLSRERPAHTILGNSAEAENEVMQRANITTDLQWPQSEIATKMDSRTRRALFVGCILMFFQQATGFNAFVYYSPLIFSEIGVDDSLLPAVAVAFINFVFTGVAMRVVDRSGRRSVLLTTVWIMTLGLIVCSVGFQYKVSAIFLIALLVYVAAYAVGMGTVPWMSVEFLPLSHRSFGASCITCTNWLTNSAISFSFLPLVKEFGNEFTMTLFALMTALDWFFIYFWYPEVKGLSLEEIGQVFEDGIDVHYVYRKYH
ncbi:LAME_0F10220g1_1 [Lachancea meyersii CBS 8951]|uniref:LAME_0F10220g1_1 n=1 Tax=Lachancea meyersii CBS 8951 TaxID=1266667 RepID=A0A1G4JVM2_9SACH|nr:LAME_0F10220g1_1 [Lachancea meyersii CBS 8951]